ncbi:MAG: PQQ-dependent sugar dehydrogenase [Sphingomonadales bacterium]|nr:PQQ-dependent sugar dehydrogenase [Sphingomonadales bacterium]
MTVRSAPALSVIASLLALAACNGGAVATGQSGAADDAASQSRDRPFRIAEKGAFAEPWAMAFRPGSTMLFITEKKGTVKWVDTGSGRLGTIDSGLPKVDYGGQGGLGDIAFHPKAEAQNPESLYLTWIEAGPGDTRGAVLGRGTLVCEQADACALQGLEVIWRQDKTTGRGHFSHRIAFSPDGRYIFLTSGERQKFDPAQDLTTNLGAVLRLNLDGSPADGNPFAARGGKAAEIWSYGHRNLLGLAFAPDGRLWEHEMGPKGGDEVNLIARGGNYGWPTKSNGSHYDGRDIPDHAPGDGFTAPKVFWNPSVSPAGLVYYTGDMFPRWKGSLLLGALSGQALIRVATDGDAARKADQWDMDARIREVEQGPDGAVWLLEDGKGGRLLRLTPQVEG